MWTAELLRKACGRWWGDPVALEQAGDVVFAFWNMLSSVQGYAREEPVVSYR